MRGGGVADGVVGVQAVEDDALVVEEGCEVREIRADPQPMIWFPNALAPESLMPAKPFPTNLTILRPLMILFEEVILRPSKVVAPAPSSTRNLPVASIVTPAMSVRVGRGWRQRLSMCWQL